MIVDGKGKKKETFESKMLKFSRFTSSSRRFWFCIYSHRKREFDEEGLHDES